MTSKHTPGPWYPSKRGPCQDILITTSPSVTNEPLLSLDVVAVVRVTSNNSQAEADAALIAAAPETAAERDRLKKAMHESESNLWDMAFKLNNLKAINAELLAVLEEMVEWDEETWRLESGHPNDRSVHKDWDNLVNKIRTTIAKAKS